MVTVNTQPQRGKESPNHHSAERRISSLHLISLSLTHTHTLTHTRTRTPKSGFGAGQSWEASGAGAGRCLRNSTGQRRGARGLLGAAAWVAGLGRRRQEGPIPSVRKAAPRPAFRSRPGAGGMACPPRGGDPLCVPSRPLRPTERFPRRSPETWLLVLPPLSDFPSFRPPATARSPASTFSVPYSSAPFSSPSAKFFFPASLPRRLLGVFASPLPLTPNSGTPRLVSSERSSAVLGRRPLSARQPGPRAAPPPRRSVGARDPSARPARPARGEAGSRPAAHSISTRVSLASAVKNGAHSTRAEIFVKNAKTWGGLDAPTLKEAKHEKKKKIKKLSAMAPWLVLSLHPSIHLSVYPSTSLLLCFRPLLGSVGYRFQKCY